MKVTMMKTAIHVAETHWEGRVSQDFHIGLFFLSYVGKWIFILNTKQYKSYPVFALKIKLGPE